MKHSKKLLTSLMTAKFPAMSDYLHCINWTRTKEGWSISFTSEVPRELQNAVMAWKNNLK